MRAVIFANGKLHQPVKLRDDDIIIAADGGAHHCLQHKFTPAVVIGDLDSLDKRDLATLESAGARILKHPTRKDYTDLELALIYAQEQQVDEVLVLAALGARWDQTIANLLMPAAFQSTRIRLVDGPQELLFVHAGEKLEITGKPGDTVSLIPLGGDAQGVTTQNLEYPLDGERLRFASSRGVSNVLLSEKATIGLEQGTLLCVVIHL
ncbi:MAG: thiamine diphosphokinase [Anaerolineales bacterium]|nr:thiamine diphosphokinase [Anaerolineales bacterium]